MNPNQPGQSGRPSQPNSTAQAEGAGKGGQIPYQVYESVHRPSVQRRQWIARLLVALLVATIIVLVVVQFVGRSRDDAGAGPVNPQVEQAPQPVSPAAPGQTTPVSGSVNKGTVTQPQ